MNYEQLFNEALDVQPETKELAKEIEALYGKHFPQGWVKALARNMFGSEAITLSFGLVSDTKELTGGYIQNDPLKQGFVIRADKKGWETSQTLGWLAINPAEGSYNAMDSIKIKFRKTTADSKKTLAALDKFFNTVKGIVKDNESNIYNRSKYSDKWFK